MGFRFKKEGFISTYYDTSKYDREKYEDAQYDLSKFVKDNDDIDDIPNNIKIEIMEICDNLTNICGVVVTLDDVLQMIDKYKKDKMKEDK